MNKTAIIVAFVVLALVALSPLYINVDGNWGRKSTWGWVYQKTYFYDGYVMKAPFGMFFVEGEGSVRGGVFVFRGSFEFRTEEVYDVKFFNGGEILTLILNAEDTPIIPDGTFGLEEIVSEYGRYFIDTGEWFYNRQHDTKSEFKIHIPFLPDMNQTITTEW